MSRKKKRAPYRRISDDEAADILLTVCWSPERSVPSWARQLGSTTAPVYAIVHGLTHKHVLPQVPRLPTRPTAASRELDEVRRMAREAAKLRVDFGALAPADVDAWVEKQVEEHRAARRAERKRAKNNARYGTEKQRRERRRAAKLEREKNLRGE